jgi:tRNA pseudouridine55 synthase
LLISPGQTFPETFPKGAILLVDKPLAWTSFDVVGKVRYHLCRRLGQKKLKVGHAGTLDPLATGLLVLCVGDFTKKIESLQSEEKTYTGTMTFGATTPSYDLEKAPDTFFPTEHIDDALLQQLLPRFTGDIRQIPPVFSAVKVDGKRVYKNARTGQEVEVPERTVHIRELTLGPVHPVQSVRSTVEQLSKRGPAIMLHPDYPKGVQCDFSVTCSKGTYIRTLANDLGIAAGSGAYLSSLRRTRSGGFHVDDAWTIAQLTEWLMA